MTNTESTAAGPGYTLWQMVLYMLRLGSLGFGGPVALVGYMHRDLVEPEFPILSSWQFDFV